MYPPLLPSHEYLYTNIWRIWWCAIFTNCNLTLLNICEYQCNIVTWFGWILHTYFSSAKLICLLIMTCQTLFPPKTYTVYGTYSSYNFIYCSLIALYSSGWSGLGLWKWLTSTCVSLNYTRIRCHSSCKIIWVSPGLLCSIRLLCIWAVLKKVTYSYYADSYR